MNLSELWKLYQADKRIQGFSPFTLKAYSLQLNVLIRSLFRYAFEEGYVARNPSLKG